MKKVLITQIILICLLLCGCSSTTANTINEVEPDPNLFYELPTTQESKFGFDGVFAYELMEKMANEEFFFYLYDSTTPDTLMEELLNWGFVEENIDVLANGYVIDFSTLTDIEKERIREVFPHNTLYAIQNGTVISTFKDYPLIPKEDSLDYDMEYKMAIESWIYSTMIGVNNHGFETITYEEVLEKIENEERFFVYVGRNSCKFCQVFTLVLKNFTETYDIKTYQRENIPLYYFDTQSYYNDIVYEKEGAKETWENIKETFNLDYVPSLVTYSGHWEPVEGKDIYEMADEYIYNVKHLSSHISSNYFKSDLATRTEMLNACKQNLYKELKLPCRLEEKTDCFVLTNLEDNRDYLFNYDNSYKEECFNPKDQWLEKVNNQEYIDIANDIYLENLQNNILKYSVLLERISSRSGDKVTYGRSLGTGFIIDIDEDCLYIATNKHVIDNDINVNNGFITSFALDRKDCSYTGKYNTKKYVDNIVSYINGISYIVGYSKEHDFAIVKFNFEQNDAIWNFKLDFNEMNDLSSPPRFDNKTPQIGDKVYHWDINNLESDKIYSKEHTITNLNTSNNVGSKLIEISAGSRHGNSGSGIFNEKGELVGMLVGSDVNNVYILPSSIILEEYEKIMGHPLYQD